MSLSEGTSPYPLGLFEGYGIEIEYMIVDRKSLAVAPISDRVLADASGTEESEIEMGALAWSNELVLHVIELKTNGPTSDLGGLADVFHADIVRVNGLLGPRGACLMPTAMHPWMHPETETRLWPHENGAVYAAFDRIFDCRGHGWSNLQSIHINLPFRDDEEFGRLHAAIRMALPILPALAASSPIVEGERSGYLDTRLEYYRKNCSRIPSVTGDVIPEPVFTREQYETSLLDRIYRDIRDLDPDRTLQHEWLNARGAIARFDRGTIEIRLLDVQESPAADLAVCMAVTGLVRALVEETWCGLDRQKRWAVEPLHSILLDVIRRGGDAVITNADYLRDLGMPGSDATAGALWRHLIETSPPPVTGKEAAALDRILDEGCLASRILEATGNRPSAPSIDRVYRSLCRALGENTIFSAAEPGDAGKSDPHHM